MVSNRVIAIISPLMYCDLRKVFPIAKRKDLKVFGDAGETLFGIWLHGHHSWEALEHPVTVLWGQVAEACVSSFREYAGKDLV